MEYTIDAKGKKLGRVAAEAASILMGKNTPAFERNTVADHKVLITNASLADINEDKLETKEFDSYTGHPVGLKF